MGDKTFGTLIHVEMMKRRVNGNLDNILENMTDLCQIRELEPLSTTKLIICVKRAYALI